VARGRALLESGQLGADTEALADAILDTLLDTHERDI
jgi:anti-sigma28 factor (negative regulator of flagellin synthesis)